MALKPHKLGKQFPIFKNSLCGIYTIFILFVPLEKVYTDSKKLAQFYMETDMLNLNSN